MKNALDYSLTDAQRHELEHERVHNEVTEVRVRSQALLRLSEGKGASVVAKENDVVRRTIYGWHWRYREGGIAALRDKPRSGRPRKWTPVYLEVLKTTLESDPKTLGYDFTLWTLERLVAHLAQVTDIELTSRSLEDLMLREGYRYRRPKYGLHHLQDVGAVERARVNLAELKKAQSDLTTPTGEQIILAMDETTLTQEPCLHKCWTKRGVQPTIPYPAGSHWNVHCFGGYNIMDDTVVATIAEGRNTQGFIAWLEELLTHAYPTQRVCLILDNASFHYSKAAQAMLELYQERLTLFFLPAHSPELNPIEGYWKHLKRQVHGNYLCNDKAELTERLLQEVANQNDKNRPKRYHLCN